MERNFTNDGGPAMNLQAAVDEINRLKAKMTAMEQEKAAEREEEAELDNIQDSQPLAQALWDTQGKRKSGDPNTYPGSEKAAPKPRTFGAHRGATVKLVLVLPTIDQTITMERNSTNDGGPAMNLQAAVGEINRLKAKMTAMEQEKAAEREEEAELDNIQDSQPLAQALWDAQVPANFKIPQLPTFEGKTDPLEHLMTVGTQTAIIGAEEHLKNIASKCKILSSTFKDAALRWYMNLPRNSIGSYTDFHKKFIHQFAGSKHVQVTATSLFGTRQGHNDNLREYLARFNEATIQISNPNQEMFVAAVLNGLKAGHFNESLAQKPASTMQEVMKSAECYIKGEERNAEKRSRDSRQKPSSRRSPERYHRRNNQRSGRYEDKGSGRYHQPWQSNERTYRTQEEYTQLNDSKVHVLDEILSSGMARLPPAPDSNARMGPNENAWCHYHRAKGHDTEKCYRSQWRLKQALAPRSPRRSPPREDDEKEPKRIAVNTIAGGFAGGGESRAAKKRYLRRINQETNVVTHISSPRAPEISFSPSDGEGVFPHNDDPLVIQVQILNCDVLIDSGSSADIMYWEAFKAMQLAGEQLQPYNGTLVGFGGEHVEVMGHVNATTTFGENKSAKTIKVRPQALADQPIISRVNMIGRANMVETSDLDPREEFKDRRVSSIEDLEPIQIGEAPHELTNLGTHLDEEEKEKIIAILGKNVDLFAWKPPDMPGIDESIITHKLAITPNSKPVTSQEEDSYLLPSMDRLIDGASGYKTLSFMDMYSGYNQIKMNTMDAPHTTFMSNTCNYHYTIMSFGLKNVGATYQRLMDRLFAHQIGKNLEVYIDDVVVKTISKGEHHEDLKDNLASVRKYNMRLNTAKCSFRVQTGKFLGFLLTNRGIEANPEKCQAIIDMRKPTSVKEVQQLTGRIVALSRFLSCAGEKVFHFFATLKSGERFTWSDKCEEAFQQLKVFLASPPILTRPQVGNPLYMYLDVSENSMSSALVQDIKGEERPVYFVSRIFREVEIRYQKIEKLSLAVVTTARRLRHYFQSHKIVVKIDHPIKHMLKKPDLAGRMVAWTVELSEYDITFVPRGNIKSQILADFILELSSPPEATNMQPWTFNNQAEYEALIAGMRLAKEMEVADLRAKSDSQLVISQVSGEFQVKDPQLIKYLEQNARADLLYKLASTKKPGNNRTIIQETVKKPSTGDLEVWMVTRNDDWRTPIIQYLENEKLPEEKEEKAESRRILNEIHNGSCGSHIGGRSLAGKVTRAGFFWPTLLSDANRHVRSCDKCQRHANLHHAPGEPLQSVMSPWPFYMWGVDILRPFTTSQGQAKFLLVAVDYFTKWIEVEPVATISSKRVKKFCWKNILCRFGIPKYIVSNNGTQFTSESVINFCQKKGICNTFISVEHPPSKWTVHSSTGETPFKMVYGADAMIPAEVDPPCWRRATLTAEVNSKALKENLDLLEEVRETAHFREFTVKQRASRKYNTRVMARGFREGDLVLKRPMGRNKGGKLAPNWEGPYRIQEAFGGGAYRLETLKGETLPRAWNVINLRFYYS
ncbi:hypothetical protein TSUD_365550 [Trifolium subterraneum]|uniref:Integrase catalytic domain-containing protein n=1 Tax=Trifolium subterraneum TaxID=3900 RepID=A0A2Z6NLY5_TRISU|nr:hypothetical protein TSUD_365550 [Trifolium subterraneum]